MALLDVGFDLLLIKVSLFFSFVYNFLKSCLVLGGCVRHAGV